jgi:hypothetical protein
MDTQSPNSISHYLTTNLQTPTFPLLPSNPHSIAFGIDIKILKSTNEPGEKAAGL